MTYADILEMDAPPYGRLFCEKGSRAARDKIKSVDPIVYDQHRNTYHPQNGFGDLFSGPHSLWKNSKSSEGEPLSEYNNYVTASDINLIFYIASLGTILPNIGFGYEWSKHIADGLDGYPFGSIVRGSDGYRYISVKSDNKDDVGEGDSWIRYRNTTWYNMSNHVQPNTYIKTMTYNHKCLYAKMRGGGLIHRGFEPIVVYRTHSVRSPKDTMDHFSWFQAYKYWIQDNGVGHYTLYCKVKGDFLPCDGAHVKKFERSDSFGISSGPLDFVDYFDSKGAYLISWDENKDPFSKVYPTDSGYLVSQRAQVKELALDAAMYGYCINGIWVKPEFEDEDNTLEYELTEKDLYELKGLLRIGGEAVSKKNQGSTIDPPASDENMVMASMLYTMGNVISNTTSVWWQVVGTDSLNDEERAWVVDAPLPSTILPMKNLSFDDPDAVEPTSYVSNGGDHNTLSSVPSIIRCGVEINLVLRKDGNDIPIQTLYRHMWSETALIRVTKSILGNTDTLSYYKRTIIPETIDRVSFPWQEDSYKNTNGAFATLAHIPNGYKHHSDAKLVIVAKYKNIPIPRRFFDADHQASNIELRENFYDDIQHMYYDGKSESEKFRTYFSMRSSPAERIQNSVTYKSFVSQPATW